MSKPFHIAIDGPVSAGKGTVSRLVADRLGILYVDTGAMYRVTALMAERAGIDWHDEQAVIEELKKAKIDMHNPQADEKDGRLTTVLLNGEDVSWQIRVEEISVGASIVAAHKRVRQVLVEKQQQIATNKDVVMEGRDITFKVLPEADLKIYLTAGDTVRAKRRHQQLLTKGEGVTFETVYQHLVARDKQDMNRDNDPLQIVEDAWVIDTSDLSIEHVVDLIVAKVKVLRGENGAEQN